MDARNWELEHARQELERLRQEQLPLQDAAAAARREAEALRLEVTSLKHQVASLLDLRDWRTAACRNNTRVPETCVRRAVAFMKDLKA